MPSVRTNEQITAREVRVIDKDGEQIGVVPLEQARALARESRLDLVEVSAAARPPVCRIMDHGKFMFERQKRERDRRKAQTHVKVKEIRMSPRTDDHDVQIALGKIERIISEGGRVKVRIRFRGRERYNQAVGMELMKRVARAVSEYAQIDAAPMSEGNTLVMALSPHTAKSRQQQQARSAQQVRE